MNSILAAASHGGGADARNRDYQELKARIHQQLLNRLNLERLNRVAREEAEPQIRDLIAERRHETRAARQPVGADHNRDINELFGLGPLEALLAIRIRPTSWSTGSIRSIGRTAIEPAGCVQRQPPPALSSSDCRSSVGGASTNRVRWWRPARDGSRVAQSFAAGPRGRCRFAGFSTRLGHDLVEGNAQRADARLSPCRGGQPSQHHVSGGRRRKNTLLNVLSGYISDASASTPSKTRPNCCYGSDMSCGSKRGRPTLRGKALSVSATSWRTPCVCAPIESFSERCAARRRSTCCRP